ncbi:glycosyltransferase [Bacillus thuringiensis]
MDEQNGVLNVATIMSKDYLIKGLSFYQSLINTTKNFSLWICCMDDFSYDTLQKLKLQHTTLIQLSDLENEELLSVKDSRKVNEYCWTVKAPLCRYVLEHFKGLDHIVYCDADIYFFSNPTCLQMEWGQNPAFLLRQRGSYELEKLHGKYQAGLIGFKNNKLGRAILQWWEEHCIEKCSDQFEETSWGDQKYLDRIPSLFPNVKVLGNIGIDVAPWNLVMHNQHTIWKKEGVLYIDNTKLVAYHFGSILILNENKLDIWKLEVLPFSDSVINLIYIPYMLQLKESIKILASVIDEDISQLYSNPKGPYSIKNLLVL